MEIIFRTVVFQNVLMCSGGCPENCPGGKLAPRSGLGFGLGLALEFRVGGQFSSEAIFLEPFKGVI